MMSICLFLWKLQFIKVGGTYAIYYIALLLTVAKKRVCAPVAYTNLFHASLKYPVSFGYKNKKMYGMKLKLKYS